MRDRKGEESGSDLPLHSGVLALPEFRIRTKNQEAIARNFHFIYSGRMKHLLSIHDLTPSIIEKILNRAQELLNTVVIPNKIISTLQGQLITHLFFEPSTRTQYSFTVSAERLGALVLNPLIGATSTVKGESLLDTVRTFIAMGTKLLVIRHSESGMPAWIAGEIKDEAIIINGGDGVNEHPTQALLDLLTIRQNKADFKPLKVAILGDIIHSRVAHSLIYALQIMGCPDIRLIGPKELLPDNVVQNQVRTFTDLRDGIAAADVIVTLRLQRERMEKSSVPNLQAFFETYGLTPAVLNLAHPEAIVLHPGPMNRGVEIDNLVANGAQSQILQQIQNGVAVRMAILEKFLHHE
jgi:aspartate carbamoyltransferase catalytic subunit